MTVTFGDLRRVASLVKRELRPNEAVSAWRAACRAASTAPRFVHGQITMGPYLLQYADLLTFCPQWDDIFVRRSLDFQTSSASPRILDCGANVGLASLFFKSRYPSAQVTAFEADPAIAGLLRSNLAKNGAGDVTVVAAAVWTQTGSVRFCPNGADAGSIVASTGNSLSVEVPCVRLHDFLSEKPVDLLKLDIEGAELDVLADCKSALRNVKAALIEIHELDARCRMTPEILQLLTLAGFDYSLTHTTPLDDAEQQAARRFPTRSAKWITAVAAWR